MAGGLPTLPATIPAAPVVLMTMLLPAHSGVNRHIAGARFLEIDARHAIGGLD